MPWLLATWRPLEPPEPLEPFEPLEPLEPPEPPEPLEPLEPQNHPPPTAKSHRRNFNSSPMSIFNTLMIITVIGSILFSSLVIRRTLQYNKKYHLPESGYTRLFGFITKEYIAAAYAAFILFISVFAIWLILTL